MQKTYTVNSKLLPAGFPREFDAHIYFESTSLSKAEHLRDEAMSAGTCRSWSMS